MSFLHIEHHGYFHGRANNDVIEYRMGVGEVPTQNVWQLGRVRTPENPNHNTAPNPKWIIGFDNQVRLNDYLPDRRENLQAVNNLTNLGPLRSWMGENPEIVNTIQPNILSNRGILRNLCLNNKKHSFLVKLEEGRYVFHTEPYNDLNGNEDLTGFALENFISNGFEDNRTYDYREKHYSIQSLTLKNWKILYNAEYDGFINLPLGPLIEGQNQGYNATAAVPCEIKLTDTIPEWKLKTWFVQSQLGNIDDIIVGINPNGRKINPLLSEIRLYKTQDLISHASFRQTLIENLENVLRFLDANAGILSRGETFKFQWIRGVLRASRFYANST